MNVFELVVAIFVCLQTNFITAITTCKFVTTAIAPQIYKI